MEFDLVGWRRGMIVAGCAIVLAATYFIWTEYSERVNRLERIERARKELFGLAEAGAHETEKVRVFCRNVKAGTVAVPADASLPRVLKRCRDFEYLD
jgi:NADH:ubiquinone oxidoreductase subunit F (NADH-binding)